MLILLGLTCVLWTTVEIVRLTRTPTPCLRAWDRCGRPIPIEEVR